MDSQASEIRLTLEAAASRFAAQTRENALKGAHLGARLKRLREGLQILPLPAARDIRASLSLRPVLALSLEAYSSISQHVIACLNELLTAGERLLGVRNAAGAVLPPAEQDWSGLPRLRLVGKPGETLETAFVIRNDLGATVNFNLRCQELSEGAAREKYQLSFTPNTDSLAPDGQRVVRLRTQLAADIAPATYHSQVTIEGLPASPQGGESKRFCIELVVAA